MRHVVVGVLQRPFQALGLQRDEFVAAGFLMGFQRVAISHDIPPRTGKSYYCRRRPDPGQAPVSAAAAAVRYFFSPPMPVQHSRAIVSHAWPILIAQLASMGMMVIDTVLLGHHGTVDLAAVAVGGGIYIAVVFALVGILQAVAPTVAHHVGAPREHEVAGRCSRRYGWPALLLPGMLILWFPDPILALSTIEPAVEESCASPAHHRLRHAGGAALPDLLFLLQCAAPAAAADADQPLQHAAAWRPLRGRWCRAFSPNRSARSAAGFPTPSELGRLPGWRPRGSPSRPRWPLQTLRQLAGAALDDDARTAAPRLPMGFSNFVEITSFITPDRALRRATGGDGGESQPPHRRQPRGALLRCRWPRHRHAGAGGAGRRRPRLGVARGPPSAPACCLPGGLSTLLGGLLWLAAEPLAFAYTSDPAVRRVSLVADRLHRAHRISARVQTVARLLLRGCQDHLRADAEYTVAFWASAFRRLVAGFRAPQPMGVEGFWLASLASLCRRLLR